jgi:hypothetical protein
LVAFDASGAINGGNALFNDTGIAYGGRFDMTSAPATARAFLLVDNNDTENFENYDYASLYGEAMVIELGSGAAWGYVAYNGSYGGPNTPTAIPFNDGVDLQGEVMRSPRYFDSADSSELESTPAILMPLTSFQTKFFVTPVNYADWEYGTGPGVKNTCSNSRIEFCLDPRPADGVFPINGTCPSGLGDLTLSGENCQHTGDAVCRHSGIWDNDETPLDGNSPVDVVCTTALDISTPGQLLTTAQIDYLTTMEGEAPTGGNGWTYVRSMVGSFFPAGALGARNVNTESDSIIGKLQYSDAQHPLVINGVTVPGSVNDFQWIRNSASQYDGDWDMTRAINAIIQDDGFGD